MSNSVQIPCHLRIAHLVQHLASGSSRWATATGVLWPWHRPKQKGQRVDFTCCLAAARATACRTCSKPSSQRKYQTSFISTLHALVIIHSIIITSFIASFIASTADTSDLLDVRTESGVPRATHHLRTVMYAALRNPNAVLQQSQWSKHEAAAIIASF